eukprot:PhM_4_TR14290/c0_g2_i1/m.29876
MVNVRERQRRHRPLEPSEVTALDPRLGLHIEVLSDPDHAISWPSASAAIWTAARNNANKSTGASSSQPKTQPHVTAPHQQLRLTGSMAGSRRRTHLMPDTAGRVILPESWAYHLPQHVSIDDAEIFLSRLEARAFEVRDRALYVSLADAVPCPPSGVTSAMHTVYRQWLEERARRRVGTHRPWGMPLCPEYCDPDPAELYWLPRDHDEVDDTKDILSGASRGALLPRTDGSQSVALPEVMDDTHTDEHAVVDDDEDDADADPGASDLPLCPYDVEAACCSAGVVHVWELPPESRLPPVPGHDALAKWRLNDNVRSSKQTDVIASALGL